MLSGRRLTDADDRLTAVELFVRDVTGRRAVTERLAQAQKLEALGRITGAIAHDFNNLLTAIVTPSEFLLQDLEAGTRHWEDCEVDQRGGHARGRPHQPAARVQPAQSASPAGGERGGRGLRPRTAATQTRGEGSHC